MPKHYIALEIFGNVFGDETEYYVRLQTKPESIAVFNADELDEVAKRLTETAAELRRIQKKEEL